MVFASLCYSSLGQAASAEFLTVSVDRANALYMEGEQAHIFVTRRILPGNPNYRVFIEAFFPDRNHPIALSQIGEIFSFVTPKLIPGEQHFIAEAYIQTVTKPPLRDGESM